MAKRKLTDEERREVTAVAPEPATAEDYSGLMQEVFNFSNIHGPVVGVIIQINLNMLQETTIFFSDGFTTVSEIPLIGYDIEKHKEYRFNLLATKKLLGQIPLLADRIEGDYICRRGTIEELEEPQSYAMTCYFVFRPPEEGLVDFSECLGIWMMDEQIRIIAEDDGSEFMAEVGAEDI